MRTNSKLILIFFILAVLVFVWMNNSLAQDSEYKITFYTSGLEIDSKIVQRNQTIELPDPPEREGYVFAGWYTSESEEQYNAFDPTQEINSDLNLYAQWIAEDHVNIIESTSADKTVELGYSDSSGIEIRSMDDNSIVEAEELETGTLDYPVYKDLNKNGKLDPYEDWRLSVDERTADLASQMSYQEIAGLMLYSSHQTSWENSMPTQAQVTFLANDDLRHVLMAGEVPAEVAAPWNNNIQAISEKLGLGIPANNSSDPRHSAAVGVEYYSDNTGTISLWPNSLGLAATFDPELVKEFAQIASKEYRALGISTALSPQIDIATEPRWNRTNGTFGEDPKLAADMTEAYVSGFQGTFADGELTGWGYDSVNAMMKHWPGGGAGEGGRDAHSDFGKYSVFPGNNFDAHTIPFVDGGLVGENGDTTMATAVMPYYTISYNVDPSGKDLSNAYSEYIISDLLRDKYNFDGVICTDWGVDGGRGWGPAIEPLDTAARSKLLIEAGVNQFGGRNTSRYILEAVELAEEEGTEEEFRDHMEFAAVRLLKNIFRTGLFENPYLDEKESSDLVGNEEFVEKGYEAQLKSIIMLKNKNDLLPLAEDTAIYIPQHEGEYIFKGAENDFTVVDSSEEADLAVVTMNSPQSPIEPPIGWAMFGGGWSPGEKAPYDFEEYPYDHGYYPLTLQYSEYTAVEARDVSIAGDYRNITEIEGTASSKYLNRSYKNRKMTATNFGQYQQLLDTKKAMGDKPVITVINLDNPMIFKEVDPLADAILLRFTASDNAVLDILSGREEPSGLLPLQMPEDMAEVENQAEDLPRDMEVYQDSAGNYYDFAFGLDWDGVIDDHRVEKYRREPLKKPQTAENSNTTADYVTVETKTLPMGQLGSEYSAKIKTKEPANLELISGDLPAGFEFENGVLAGTPVEKTDKYGEQLKLRAAAAGKLDRVFRITLVVNETGPVNLADPNQLSILINLAQAENAGNYTDQEWEELNEALRNAKAVYQNAAELEQVDLDRAAERLERIIK
ncbi:putative repeat protein (TIGR02543 family) [Halanaerobium saccharolyticum]|uniref:beta-glucosidase n=1 Tax=Halanaerobium saccharolyticum TaxID=43595 RepID=A0A4R7Z8G9_9FIRM|nr:glycoside hydrolase family 3 N-terminal domain-containing protein [Halanaerobium saccharolyticum]RAK11696.1 putative repeat protein (TIGR02543 family) [Halanaerobium saccharolyticum]TDW07537.1 putative repeat protein (TIGR02543 family) [Halanaerobium saccharolyticum]TDX64458.1 putative repeat protein (TIGR02543 family) [Halanaerobium saccharolyticum]